MVFEKKREVRGKGEDFFQDERKKTAVPEKGRTSKGGRGGERFGKKVR